MGAPLEIKPSSAFYTKVNRSTFDGAVDGLISKMTDVAGIYRVT